MKESPLFIDVTSQSGIDYLQYDAAAVGGPASEQIAMSGGAAAGDYDGDGYTDLYVTRLDAPDILYRNRGDGTFEDVTASSRIDRGNGSNGAGWADVDQDGDLDLYVTSLADTQFFLYLNDGQGRFTESAIARGAAIASSRIHNGFSVSFTDIDNDGYVDIHTTEWGTLINEENNRRLTHARLLRNQGTNAPGFFVDITDSAGIKARVEEASSNTLTFEQVLASSLSFTSRFADFDRDGYVDLALISDFGTSQFYWNNGDGTFTESTEAAGVGTDENGMGAAVGDVDGDGLLDLFVTSIFDPDETCEIGSCNWGYSGNRLYLNNGDRTFSDITDQAGVRDGGWGWGTTFLDYDNDGDQDLVMTNGVNFGDSTNDDAFEADPMRFWENDGAGNFTEVSAAVGITDRASGKGLLKFDYDNDGDLDLFVVNNAGQPVLYRNDGGNAQDWLRVSTFGSKSSLGAKVSLTAIAGSATQFQEVQASSSFLGQDEAAVHFGLGTGQQRVHQLQIDWLAGQQRQWAKLPRNVNLAIAHGSDPAMYNGTSYRDYIYGSTSHDQLAGQAGADRIDAGSGHDHLSDGKGADQLIAGKGNDWIALTQDRDRDTVIYRAGDGLDVVSQFSRINWGDRLRFERLPIIDVVQFQNDTLFYSRTRSETADFDPKNLLVAVVGTVGFTANDIGRSLTATTGTHFNFFSGEIANAPPIHRFPARQQMNAQSQLVFSKANGNAIVVLDADSGDRPLTLQLQTSQGTLRLGSTEGIRIIAGTNNSPVIKLRGKLDALNRALERLRLTPPTSIAGAVTVTLTTIDSGGSTPIRVTDTITVDVVQMPSAPTLAQPIPDQTVTEDQSFDFRLATDTFRDRNPGDTLHYTATLGDGSGLPDWLTFNPETLEFRGTPTQESVGELEISVTATDETNLTATTRFTLSVLNQNNAPTVTNPIPMQTAIEDESFAFALPPEIFVDRDGDALTYSASLASQGPLPSWLSFDPQTQTLQGQPSNEDVGTLTLRITGTDPAGESASTAVALEILNTNDAPTDLILSSLSVRENQVGALVGRLSTVDVDSGDRHTYELIHNPGNAFEIQNDQLRLKPGQQLDFENRSSYSVSILSQDLAGEALSKTFTLTVEDRNDTPFVNQTIADQAIRVNDPWSFGLPTNTFVDQDMGDRLSYRITLANDQPLPDWLAFNPQIQQFTGTPSNGDRGELNLQVIATDMQGASVSTSFSLTIQDTQSPTELNPIVGTAGGDTLDGTERNDEIRGKDGFDVLSGKGGDDVLAGGGSFDWLEGGEGADRFLFDADTPIAWWDFSFDWILDFTPSVDKIVLSKQSFTAIASQPGNGFSEASDFAIVEQSNAVSVSNARIVYNQADSGLYYNENGGEVGIGNGGLFAVLSGTPSLSSSDFVIR